jgi:hypothetical protein
MIAKSSASTQLQRGLACCLAAFAGLTFAVPALAAPASAAPAAEQMLPHSVDRTLKVVIAGQSQAVIVYPSVAEGQALAGQVRDAIKAATGVELKIAADTDLIQHVPEWPGDTYRAVPLILIGNINTNRAIVPLYANLLAGADVYYPGGDGYTVRTVVNPYGNGINELVLGGASVKGMDRAVKAFVALVQKQAKQGDLTLPGLMDVHPEGEAAKEVDTAIKASASDHNYDTPLNYQWTASPDVLKKVLADLRAEKYMKADAKNLDTADYGTEMTVRGLISLIDVGALSDDEVHHLETMMLAELHREEGVYPWNTIRPKWVGTRHQAMGLGGTMVMADYLLNHAKPNPEAADYLKKRLDQARAYFQQFETLYRDEGNDNTSQDSNGPIIRYFMAFGNSKLFQSGTAEKMAQRSVMMTDNEDHFVGPGNYEDSRPGAMSDTLLRFPHYSIGVTAFVNSDPGLNWLLKNGYAKPLSGKNWAMNSGIAGERYPLPPDMPASKPTQWLGASVLHLTPYHYLLTGSYMTHGAIEKEKQPWESLVPMDKALDMVSFRDGYKPGDQYLFIIGTEGGRYDSMGSNSIVRYADRGHLWLIAQTEQFGHYFHNALHIGRTQDGKYLSTPGAIRLDALANFDDVSMSATTLPGFNGADWTRNILWLHGKYFVVIDTARFNEDGNYDLTCTWRSLPIAQLDPNGVWRAKQGDSQFELHNADGLEQQSTHERAENTEQIAVYPYALRQHEALTAHKGDHVSIKNLFFTEPRDAQKGFDLRQAGPDAVMVSDGSYFSLAGVNPGTDRAQVGHFTTDARMFVASTDSIRLTPASAHLWLDGKEVSVDKSSPEVSAALKALWPTLEPAKPAVAKTASKESPAAQPLWSYDGYQSLPQEIGGVRLVSPEASKDADLLFDRQALNYVPRISWPSGTKVVTYDLGQVEDISRIQLERMLDYKYLNSESPDRQPFWVREKAGSMHLGFSNDNFATDKREMDIPYDLVYRQDVPYHYKWTYMPSYWKQLPSQAAGPLNIKARYIQTPPGQTFETTFFRAVQRPADIDRLCAVDLDGDGKQELAVATEARQVSVLNEDGTVRWTQTLDNRITDLLALDLNGDGKKTLLVSDNGWYVRGFNAKGEQVYSADTKKEGMGGAFALGSIVPKGADSKKPFIVVGATRGATVLDPDGHSYCVVLYGLSVSDVVLGGKTSNPLAMYRTGTRNPWQIAGWKDMLWFPPDQRQRPVETKMYGGSMEGPWWLSYGMEYWPEDGAPADAASADGTSAEGNWRDGMAVVIARAGIYAYDLGSKTPANKPIWRVMANGPISGYAWANMDGKPGMELVVCRQDGFVDVLDRGGKVIQSWPVGAAAHSVCRWDKGGAALAVATGDAVIFYDTNGKEISRVATPAQKLIVLHDGQQQILIAAAPGHTTAFH